MSAAMDHTALHALLCGSCRVGEDEKLQFSPLTTLHHSLLKHRFTFLFPPPSDLYSLLDVAKV